MLYTYLIHMRGKVSCGHEDSCEIWRFSEFNESKVLGRPHDSSSPETTRRLKRNFERE